MQFFIVLIDFKEGLYWSYTGVVLELKFYNLTILHVFACYVGGLWGASGLAASRRRRGAGQPRSVGRVGALGLAASRRRRGAGQPQSVGWCGWLGGLEFLAGWLVRVGKCGGRGQPAKSPTRCVGLPKIPKIPKIPIIVDVFGELKTTPVILHGSNPVTKLKKKSYNYALMLMIVNISLFTNVYPCLQM